ncbi:MAG: hypothetical protein KKD44_25175 [Proteobacteria bacterium]|nr:hypothetical protein [Pseudomonadota bacterium]
MESLQKNDKLRKQADRSDHHLSALITGIMKTRETRLMMADLVPEIIYAWAGSSRIKKKIAGQTDVFIKKMLLGSTNGSPDITLNSLLEDPEFMSMLTRFLPEAMGEIVDAFNAVSRNFESVSDEDREVFFSKILKGLSSSRLGESLTLLLKTVNQGYQTNPNYLKEKCGPALVSWLEALDVGEIRDFLDHSRDDIQGIVSMLVDTLYKYPSKLVLFLSFIADAVNTLADSSAEFIAMLNKISPDLLTDVAFSVFRTVDGKSVGKLINEGAEIIRKLHAGSALIADPGTTQLPMDLSKFLGDVLSVLDGDTLWKAKVAIAEEQEIISKVFYAVLKENPERLERRMIRYATVKNSTLRSLTHRLSSVDQLPDEKVADAVENSLKNIDTQDAAEVINLFCLLLNKVRSLKPAIIADIASQFIESIDLFEVQDNLNWLSDDLAEPLLPLGRILAPKLVKGLCRALAPRDDEHETEAEEARQMLRSLLMTEEVIS